MHVACRGAWRRPPLAETNIADWGGGAGLSRTRMQAKPDCDRATFDLDCSKATDVSWLDAVRTWGVRTLTADLRVSPSLKAAGFQEMWPALALALASIGRCVYGHQAG
jgi:hypothetical protein